MKVITKTEPPKDLTGAGKQPGADPMAKGSPSAGAGETLGVGTAAPAPAPAASGGNRIEGAGGYAYEVNGDKVYIVQSPKHPGETIRLPVSISNPGYSAIAAELASKGVKLPVAPRGGVLDGPMFNSENIQPDEAAEPMFNAHNIDPTESPTRITLPSVPAYKPARGPANVSISGIAEDLQSARDSFLPRGTGAGRSLAELTELALAEQSS